MESQDEVEIKKVIVSLDDTYKSYSFDVDCNINFDTLKKIIIAATHLLKNSFIIFFGEKEYTNEVDELTIKNLFGEINPIPLHIMTNKYDSKISELNEELAKISQHSNSQCKVHNRYETIYCHTCKKSICFKCVLLHNNHNIEEKGNFLDTRGIINNIFANSSIDKEGYKISQYNNCIKYISNLKYRTFNYIKQLLETLEMKFEKCLNTFTTSILETEKNINTNLEVLKKLSAEYLIQFTRNINATDILIKDDLFLAISKKAKDIDKFQKDYFDEIVAKYKKLNNLYLPFITYVDSISKELEMTICKNINLEVYAKFKEDIKKYSVPQLQGETVKKLIISLNKNNDNNVGVDNMPNGI